MAAVRSNSPMVPPNLNPPIMKTKIPFLAACVAFTPALASAFTLDFSGYNGLVLSAAPVAIPVPGYGNVVFQAVPLGQLPVSNLYVNDNGFGGPSLNFEPGESLRITFEGAQPLNVDFDFVGLSVGELFVITPDPAVAQAYVLTYNPTPGDGAGLYAISWQQVPEPASAMLGLLGTAVFTLRRRR